MTHHSIVERVSRLSTAKQQLLAAQLVRRADDQLDGKLVGYVTSYDSVDADALRDFCEARLPGYMVPQVVVLLEDLPHTPTGKIDRAALACRPVQQAYGGADDAAEKAGRVAPGTKHERVLAEIWANVLGFDEVGVNEDFFELGGDSLLSIRILSRATKAGLAIDPEKFLAYPTIAEQARFVASGEEAGASRVVVQGRLPLTPIQHWFFEHITVDPGHWNQSVWLTVSSDVDFQVVEQALAALVAHHDGLRLGFSQEEGVWHQQVEDCVAGRLLRRVESSQTDARDQKTLRRTIEAESSGEFDLAQPPLLRGVYLTPAQGDAELLLVFHHLIVDELSMHTLIEDLETLCGQLVANRQPELSGGTPYSQWALRLAELGESDKLREDFAYWCDQAEKMSATPSIADASRNENSEGSSHEELVALDAELIGDLIAGLPQKAKSQINHALLAALALALVESLQQPSVLIDVEGHGRECMSVDLDIMSTVGWCTVVYPVLLSPAIARPIGDVLAEVKEQLNSVPNSGVGFGAIREHGVGSVREKLRGIPYPEICFNYLGRQNDLSAGTSLLELSEDETPNYFSRSPSCPRAYGLEVNAFIDRDNRLQTRWTYCGAVFGQHRISKLTQAFRDHLGRLAETLRAPGGIAATPTDFPLADLDQSELQQISRALKQGGSTPKGSS